MKQFNKMAFCELIYFYGINHDITIDTSYILHVKLFSYDIFVYVFKNLIGEIDRFSVFVKGFQYVILLVVWGEQEYSRVSGGRILVDQNLRL